VAHWYTASGKLVERVENKSRPGEFRDITIRDVRAWPEPLYPSVTTLLQIVRKPELDAWFIEQALKHALNDPCVEEDPELWVKRIAIRAGEVGRQAADFGTAIHAAVAEQLGGRPVAPELSHILAKPIATRVCEWLENNGYRVLETERTVVSKQLEAAGTIDIQAEWQEKNVIVDLKSREFTKKESVQAYRDHKWQVAGYNLILDGWADECHLLYISRTDVGAIQRVICGNPTEDTRVFTAIHELWKAVNNWK
jgi:hypothetical protein